MLSDRELRRVIWACALLAGFVLILTATLNARGLGPAELLAAGIGAVLGLAIVKVLHKVTR